MEWGGTDQQLFESFSASACKSRAVKILLLTVRKPAYEPDAFRIQVTGADAVLICSLYNLNPLTPKDPYSGRTAPLTSKRFILYIYSTSTGTEYFKHGIYCPFFSLSLFKMQFVSQF